MNIYCIVEYGHRELTLDCIKSIKEQDKEGLIFVGNDAYPYPLRPFPNGFKPVLFDYIENKSYTANTNRVVRDALLEVEEGEYCLFVINNDITFLSNSIHLLSEFAMNNKCICSPSIVVPKAKKQYPWKQMIFDTNLKNMKQNGEYDKIFTKYQ